MSKIEKILGDSALKVFKGFVLEKDITLSNEDLAKIKKIVIIVRHQLGDMLCSLPMIYSVRKNFPSAEIILVTKRSTGFSEIFENNSNSPVNKVMQYEHGFEKFVETVKQLTDFMPDMAIVPSSVIFSATNHLLAYYSKAGIRVGVRSKDYEPNKIGYTLNVKNDFLWDSKKVHQVNRNLDVIRQAGIEPAVNYISVSLGTEQISSSEEFFSENFPDSQKKVIGIHPGAAKEQNVWPPEKFAQLMNLFNSKQNVYFYISEGPADKKYVNELKSILKKQFSGIEFSVFCGKLMENAANISKTALFISNDTGIMHLASGFDIPVIGLFGPTKAYEWGPLGLNKASIQASDGRIENIEISDVFETGMGFLSV
ncbi:MAG TPA: glycosyltransferase family 9 protein [Ignavibacteria bacterium]|nr:glycosyltransferase family 9 protein [Ignavibacteria bacterium]